MLSILVTGLLAGADVGAVFPGVEALYRALHQAPELSGQEEKTAARLAQELRGAGFTVTTGVGGHGLVGVLKNGPGPTLWLRTDLDGLPVKERTGLPYASAASGRGAGGAAVPVMHACGHDVHMASWAGAGRLLAADRASWRGTLVLLGQPAEEVGNGAKGMVRDGLFTRFPAPDALVALHTHATLPAGTVGVLSGFALANVDSVDVTLFGRGGHGAYPHQAVDPVVLAAKVVLGLQTLVSRELSPLEPGVVTVGSIHGGTKHNIIPDEVTLQLSLRSYASSVRQALREGVRRVAEAESVAARSPRPPVVTVDEGPSAVFNDPSLTEQVAVALRGALGAEAVRPVERVMGAEDFSEYARATGRPAVLVWLGTVRPDRFPSDGGVPVLPSLHSAEFAPDKDATLRTGVTALAAMARAVLKP